MNITFYFKTTVSLVCAIFLVCCSYKPSSASDFDFHDTLLIHKPDVSEEIFIRRASQNWDIQNFIIDLFGRYLYDPNSPYRLGKDKKVILKDVPLVYVLEYLNSIL